MANALPVFVSHSHEDSAFCLALITALRGAGADVWYDEQNMGAGHLMDVIQQELGRRKIFIVILSKAAFASKWVRRETGWAYSLYDRDPTRVILPITAAAIDRDDFSPEKSWLFLEDFKRIESPGYQPYPVAEAVSRALHALALTPAGTAPAPMAPQPTESVDDLITRGTALREQGKFVEALALYERATQLDPNSYLAWFNVAYARSQAGFKEQAVVAYDRAISLNLKEKIVWYNKGVVLQRDLQRSQEALAAFEQTLALDPSYVDALNWKGNALNDLTRYQEALAAFEQALALDPKLVHAWNGKGNALTNMKRYQEALVAFEQALTLDPTYAMAWRNKAMTLNDLQRYQEALTAADRSLALEPQSAWAWRRKAAALRGLGRAAEAAEAEARAKALGG